MIQPWQRNDAFLRDVRRDGTAPDEFRLWWLGQSGFLLQWQGRHLLLDPYLSDSLTRKYAGTDKPHVRMTERVIAPDRLDFIDVVTSSHAHTDHLDPETLQPIFKANRQAKLVMPEAIRAVAAERAGLPAERLVGLDAGQSAALEGFELTAVPAAHESLDKDAEGRHLYVGYIIAFGPFHIYHSGDTLRFDGMTEWLKPWSVDVALLPINGRHPARRVAGNLDGPEAAALARDIAANVVIPCHYEMFEFNTASPEPFARAADQLGQRYCILRAGEGWRYGR